MPATTICSVCGACRCTVGSRHACNSTICSVCGACSEAADACSPRFTAHAVPAATRRIPSTHVSPCSVVITKEFKSKENSILSDSDGIGFLLTFDLPGDAFCLQCSGRRRGTTRERREQSKRRRRRRLGRRGQHSKSPVYGHIVNTMLGTT